MSEFSNYKPNSNKSKEEAQEREKRVEKPVVSGGVKIKKKSEASKLADVFIAEDASNVKNYIFMDVLVPTIKKMLYEAVTGTIDMLLFGGTGSRSDRRTNGSYVSYNRFSDRDRRETNRYDNARARGGFRYDDIIFDHRSEAEEVLSQMDDILGSYPYVTVADLFDLVGQTCDFTCQRYGWTNLRNAEVVRVRDGYMLKLPKALPID